MDAIVATVVLLLPGFIASAVLDYLLLRRQRGQFDRTAESLALTFFVYGATTIVPRLFDLSLYARRIFEDGGRVAIPNLFTTVFLRDLGFLVILATLFALAFGYLLKLSVAREWWVRLFGRNYYSRVWDSAFDRNTNDYVVQVDMKDGQTWLGTILESSDTTGEREILLGNPAELKNGAVLPSKAAMILIDGGAIQRLFFVPLRKYLPHDGGQ